jgi:hypothetical protein
MITEFTIQIFASAVGTKVLNAPNPNLGFRPTFELFIGIKCLILLAKKVEMCPAGVIICKGSIVLLLPRSLDRRRPPKVRVNFLAKL